MNPAREYADFVEHPRFGRTPRFTHVRTGPVPLGYRLTNYLRGIIDGTAVAADLERQSPSPFPVLYYFDISRICLDCSSPFIFFAEEQKHWYETLGFVLAADCVRCPDCRRKQHGLERKRRRFEELCHVDNRSAEESLEMAECCVSLIEEGLFHRRQTERVRMLLNSITTTRNKQMERGCNAIRRRLRSFETGDMA